MMTKQPKIICIGIVLFLLNSSLSFAGTTGAAFLKIGVGARAAGMGSAFTALSDDASGIYWNPAGIASISEKQVMFMHSNWIEDLKYDFAGFVKPVKTGVLGLAASYLSQGDFQGRDENRQPTSSFSAYDMALLVSMAKKTDYGSLGANCKIIREVIESENATGIAVDLGSKIQYPDSKFSFGLVLQNLGPQMKFINDGYNLPLSLAA
ncbi:MAG: PorV/PorQ family protein, partial [Elusimicrobia bacterium]|nr:PorV/PorQ family protein [Candidatus Liberimonas magnetica]